MTVIVAAHLPIGGIDARGVNIDNNLARSGDGIRRVAVLQHLGSAVFVEIRCFHHIRALALFSPILRRQDGIGVVTISSNWVQNKLDPIRVPMVELYHFNW